MIRRRDRHDMNDTTGGRVVVEDSRKGGGGLIMMELVRKINNFIHYHNRLSCCWSLHFVVNINVVKTKF